MLEIKGVSSCSVQVYTLLCILLRLFTGKKYAWVELRRVWVLVLFSSSPELLALHTGACALGWLNCYYFSYYFMLF